MAKNKIKISQSLMKSLFDYSQGKKCGKLIEEHYVNGVPFPSSEVMELGNYFEFICTGSLAREGYEPKAKTTKKGEPTSKYKLMNEQKVNFDRIMQKYGFKILSIDHHFKSESFSGIADIIAEKDGEKVIIDVKTSGLINDRWSDFGWHEDSIHKNENLLIQAKHYKMLAQEEWGIENIPFYYLVFSTVNSVDCKVYSVDCSYETLSYHRLNANGAIEMLDQYLKDGFSTLPDYKSCMECPLKENCKDFTDTPVIKTINI
jgi:hypothetical protein